MKWPIVWRETMYLAVARESDLRISEANMHITQLQEAFRMMDRHTGEANQRYESLLSRYHMLRLQGASEAPAAPAMPERPTPDPVTTAINEASAGKDAKVRKAMLEQVKRDRAAGLKDADIITRIARGNRVADELEATK